MHDYQEILGRIDERVNYLCENQDKLAERFDRFIDQHTQLVERVAHIEATLSSANVYEVEDLTQRLEIKVGMHSDKLTALEVRLSELENRVFRLERQTENTENKVQSWGKTALFVGEVVFKCLWVVGMAYILYRFGLGGVNFPP